jgi:hypothetical protein
MQKTLSRDSKNPSGQKEFGYAEYRGQADARGTTSHSSKWTLSDMVVTPTTLRAGGGFSTGDPVFPQVMFVSECGYTCYFSGSSLGLTF